MVFLSHGDNNDSDSNLCAGEMRAQRYHEYDGILVMVLLPIIEESINEPGIYRVDSSEPNRADLDIQKIE